MSIKHYRLALMLATFLILAATTNAVMRFEQTLAEGTVVLLELAPVDPRSMMQGDYMALAFAIDRRLPDDAAKYRYVWLTLDASKRASLHSMADQLPENGDLVAVIVRQRDGHSSIGPNGFFFTEGQADTFASARYGEFRIDGSGKALLSRLLDEQLQPLGTNQL